MAFTPASSHRACFRLPRVSRTQNSSCSTTLPINWVDYIFFPANRAYFFAWIPRLFLRCAKMGYRKLMPTPKRSRIAQTPTMMQRLSVCIVRICGISPPLNPDDLPSPAVGFLPRRLRGRRRRAHQAVCSRRAQVFHRFPFPGIPWVFPAFPSAVLMTRHVLPGVCSKISALAKVDPKSQGVAKAIALHRQSQSRVVAFPGFVFPQRDKFRQLLPPAPNPMSGNDRTTHSSVFQIPASFFGPISSEIISPPFQYLSSD